MHIVAHNLAGNPSNESLNNFIFAYLIKQEHFYIDEEPTR